MPAADADPAADAQQQFERRYGVNGPARRQARELWKLLRELREQGQEAVAPAECARRLLALWGWVLGGRGGTDLYGADGADDPRTARLRFLLSVLEREEALAAPVRARLSEVLAHTSVVRLLCSSGLPSETGFFGELRSRVAMSLLPDPPDDRDVSRLLARAFRKPADVAWLKELSDADACRLADALFVPEAREALSRQRRRALAVVSTRVASLGVAEDVVVRAGDDPQGPFLRLGAVYTESPAGRGTVGERVEVVADCRARCRRVFAHLDSHGVSTDLVYRLECIQHGLDRLVALEEAPPVRLLAAVLVDAQKQRSVTSLFKSTSRQLARKIAERSGDHGDHYITRTRRDWVKMLSSAGGGGVLTTGTTFLKFLVGWMTLPLFFEGTFNSLNYALSFLVMQMLGFTLATKQPSMTAAAIAAALGRGKAGPERHEAVVDLVARVSRSQLAAVLGNIGLVIPTCIAADLLYRHFAGRSFFDAFAGTYVAGTLHPLKSGTIPYAALTGVLLWMSSMAAGWLDNWVAYRQLPEAVAHSPRFRAFLGERGAGALGRVIGRWASPFMGCVSLGMFLGFVPLLGEFFGLPLDVRHVTLSTGALTLAFQGMGWEGFVAHGGLAAMAGIGVIGLLNFGVSFACALVVAVRSREVPWREDVRLGGALLKGFLTRPGRFFFPPASPGPVVGEVALAGESMAVPAEEPGERGPR